jgi:hypothetical protein
MVADKGNQQRRYGRKVAEGNYLGSGVGIGVGQLEIRCGRSQFFHDRRKGHEYFLIKLADKSNIF